MPFLTVSTGLVLANDYSKHERSLVLTNIGSMGLDQKGDEFRRDVYRGVLHEMGSCWQELPILRVKTENFNKDDWKRFYTWFLKQRKTATPSVHFQPEMYDIEDDEFECRALPLEIIEKLEKDGVLNDCLKEPRVNENRLKCDESFLTRYKEKLSKINKVEKSA